MEEVTISVGGRLRTVAADRGANLLTILQQAGVAISAPCGGNRTCGKCLIRARGALSAVTPQEGAFLAGRAPETRLACFATVQGPCTVAAEEVDAGSVLTGGTARTASKHPLFGDGYGVAVDIGTTTIAAYLFGGMGDAPLAVAGEFNCQQRYGADVMTRIAFTNEDKDHTLCDLIRHQLVALIAALCHMAEVAVGRVTAVVLTGNTTMLHLLADLEVRSLAMAPFTPVSVFGCWQEMTLPGLEQTRCYLPQCISAYVGADITCGILASGMMHRSGTILLVDIGTNGEMALKTGDRLVCCSTSAGPAFEGAGISCGSGAAAGAISRVQAVDGQLCYDVIGGGKAVSLCGSGLIDAVAASLSLGYLNPAGRLNPELNGSIHFPDCDVVLTQKDIRQVQLAKGAIRTGVDTMLHQCELTYEDIDEVVLCGGFGSYLSPASAEAIGMLPPDSAGKVQVIGNAAGSGAAMLLLDEDAVEAAAEIARQAVCIELSTNPFFIKQFIAQLSF